MRMIGDQSRSRPRRVALAGLIPLVGCGAASAVGSAGSPSAPSHPGPTPARAVQVVVPGADRFAPSVLEARAGQTITFHNADADAHTVTSLPADPISFDITLQPGQSATLVLGSPGAYRYYCRLHARYDATTDQVAGLPNADRPNEPMAGVLVVGSLRP